MPDPYRILVTGSRSWQDRQTIIGALMDAIGDRHSRDVVIVHGGAAGVDTMAAQFAEQMKIEAELHTPDWASCTAECPRSRRHRRPDRHGGEYCPSAGHHRNQAMVDAGADICLAFIHRHSSGASDCARRAEEAGIPTKRYTA